MIVPVEAWWTSESGGSSGRRVLAIVQEGQIERTSSGTGSESRGSQTFPQGQVRRRVDIRGTGQLRKATVGKSILPHHPDATPHGLQHRLRTLRGRIGESVMARECGGAGHGGAPRVSGVRETTETTG